MIQNRSTYLLVDNSSLFVATGVTVELTQELIEYTPLPGSTADDGWKRYTPGKLSWSLSAEALFSNLSASYFSSFITATTHAQRAVRIIVGSAFRLDGTAYLSGLSVTDTKHQLAKLTGQFTCNSFPTLTTL